MPLDVLPPDPDLSPWVVCGVHLAFDSTGAQPLPCHFPALVEGGLSVVLDGCFLAAVAARRLLPLASVFVSGPSPQPLTLYRTPRLRCVGLRLQPAGTQAVLGDSPLRLGLAVADGADVFGPAACAALQEQLAGARAASQAVDRLMTCLRQRLQAPHHAARVRQAMQLVQTVQRHAGVGDAAAAAGLSLRQFERVFSHTFGVRPKLFQRVARAEGLLRDALRTGSSGAELALRHGYFDQSHMGRDLRALAGASLGALQQAVRDPASPHWALAAGTRPLPVRGPLSFSS